MKSFQQGIGLVEVMIALLLLAIAVLGFTAMQMTAVRATDESLLRTRALTVMRGGAEMMRANPSGISAFSTALNGASSSVSNTDTGNITITNTSCSPAGTPLGCTIRQLAVRDALALKLNAVNNNMKISMVDCSSIGAKVATSTMNTPTANAPMVMGQGRQCMIASWGMTQPTLDDTEPNVCAKTDGTYKVGAQCFIMEAY